MSCMPKYKYFLTNMEYARNEQIKILLELIRKNEDTVFGREHKFKEINNYDMYQKNIPLMNSDEYLPFMDKIRNGENSVLTKENVFLLEPTGGSSGGTKLIPYTSSLRREFLLAICPWVVNMMNNYPGLMKGRSYWTITPKISKEDDGESEIPIGFDDDFEYFGSIGKILRFNSVIPSKINELTEINRFKHITSCCLLSANDLSFISIWNPSLFSLFIDHIENSTPQLIKDIHDGIKGFVESSPQRAKEIEECMKLDFSQRYEAIWKELSLISCWMDGASSVHANRLKDCFPNVQFQNKGLLATEGVITIPWKESGGNVPAYTSHFFEFINKSGSFKLIDELKEQEEYTVVITTGSGLYRYNMGDRVKVESFYNGLPVLKFIGREKLSDLVGEKLDDVFVSRAIENTIKEMGIESDFVMLAPEIKSNGGQYILYIHLNGNSEKYNLLDLRSKLELRLMDNFHYRHALEVEQLTPLKIFLINNDAKNVYTNRCISEGQKLGDVKSTYLDNRHGWIDYFQGELLNI